MNKMTVSEVPWLVRREIEALCIKPFLDAFAEELGWERTLEIAGKAIDSLAAEAGKAFASGLKKEDLIPAVREQLLSHNDSGDCRNCLIEEAEDHVTVHTEDCEYVRMYERIGMKDLGYMLSCRRDIGFYDAVDEKMRMVREGTRMQGCEICDFRVELEQ